MCRLSIRATRQLYSSSSDILCPDTSAGDCSYVLDMEPFNKVWGDVWRGVGGWLKRHGGLCGEGVRECVEMHSSYATVGCSLWLDP